MSELREQGEQAPLDTYAQSLVTAVNFAGRFQNELNDQGSHDIFVTLHWEGQKVSSIEAREVLEIQATDKPAETAVTYRRWLSTTPYPTVETATTDYLLQKPNNLELADFAGKRLTYQSLFGPLVEAKYCQTEADQRHLLEAVSASGAGTGHGKAAFLSRMLRRTLTDFSSEQIATYIRLIDGLDDTTLGPYSKLNIAQRANQKIVADLALTDTPADNRLKGPQLYNAVLALEAAGCLDAQFFRSPFAQKHFAFAKILHQRLADGRVTETLEQLNKTPLEFAREYIGIVLEVYLAQRERNRTNALIILDTIKQGPVYQSFVNLTGLIKLANEINRGVQASNDKQPDILPTGSISDLRFAGTAFFQILGMTRSEKPDVRSRQVVNDKMQAEIINMLLEPVVSRELGRKALTIGDVPELRPDMTAQDPTNINYGNNAPDHNS